MSGRCGAFPDPELLPGSVLPTMLPTCGKLAGHEPPHRAGFTVPMGWTRDAYGRRRTFETRYVEWCDPPFVDDLPAGVRARVERVVPPVRERAAGWLRRLAARLDP
jgi:hypothetical protein